MVSRFRPTQRLRRRRPGVGSSNGAAFGLACGAAAPNISCSLNLSARPAPRTSSMRLATISTPELSRGGCASRGLPQSARSGQGFTATYEMTEDGSLKARFERGDNASSATMAKADLASLTKPDAVVAWTRGKSEFLQTDLIEDGKPVRLEAVIFRPAGAGPFPRP